MAILCICNIRARVITDLEISPRAFFYTERNQYQIVYGRFGQWVSFDYCSAKTAQEKGGESQRIIQCGLKCILCVYSAVLSVIQRRHSRRLINTTTNCKHNETLPQHKRYIQLFIRKYAGISFENQNKRTKGNKPRQISMEEREKKGARVRK